jgi:hypothetical protein
MLAWTRNAPHRLENGAGINVSLSAAFAPPRGSRGAGLPVEFQLTETPGQRRRAA